MIRRNKKDAAKEAPKEEPKETPKEKENQNSTPPAGWKVDWKVKAWTDLLSEHIDTHGRDLLGAGRPKQFWMMLFSRLSYWESNHKPECTYTEKFKDNDGKNVVSRGLLQVSIESANHYGCGIKNAQELHDPGINLRVGVTIANYWVKRKGLVDGMAMYWSPFRDRTKTEDIVNRAKESCK